jgi:chorismate mutase/prephenate dehydrogenase
MTDSSDQAELEALREQLNEIDAGILKLVADRQNLVKEIGRVKKAMGRGTRDFAREKVVIDRVRGLAGEVGVDPATAEALFGLLIQQSLKAQEHNRVAEGGSGDGRQVLVIGGAGRMGAWFVRFLDVQGYAVTVADPGGELEGFDSVPDWEKLDLDRFHMIIVATPIRPSNEILQKLAQRRPTGVVFDISSLKDPVRPGLDALRDAGVSVTSVHPLFGPNVELLSGRHVIFVDVGDHDALEQARGLFTDTMATVVEMDLEQHDRAMAFVLGLSHALNIVFTDALARSGERAERLHELSSTTFANQLSVASVVASENPHLYFEIQALNPYSGVALDALGESIESLRRSVGAQEEPPFLAMMERARDYLSSRSD